MRSATRSERPFDDCYECQNEPSCTGGVCESVCGCGQRDDDEECDDGNVREGDGCSANCEEEEGHACTDITGDPPEQVTLPSFFRDMIGSGNVVNTGDCDASRSTRNAEPCCFHFDFNGV